MASKSDLPKSYTLNYTIHPETLSFLNRLSESGWKAITPEEKPEDLRKYWDSLVRILNPDISFDGQIRNYIIPIQEKDGVTVTVYKPTNIRKKPSIFVYFHGGGWTIGSSKMSEDACKMISSESGCICVNVEYSLCPEVKLSSIYSEARTILRYIIENKKKFGGTPESAVGVGGDSAGGAIAAHMSHDVPGIAYQVLVYASTDKASSIKTAEEFHDDAIIPKATRDWFSKQRFGDQPVDGTDPKLFVCQRPSFTGIPPALFIVSQLDPLRDDSFRYNEKLKAAGVQTELHLFEGVTHLFFLNPGIFKENCKRAYTCVSEFIGKFQ